MSTERILGIAILIVLFIIIIRFIIKNQQKKVLNTNTPTPTGTGERVIQQPVFNQPVMTQNAFQGMPSGNMGGARVQGGGGVTH